MNTGDIFPLALLFKLIAQFPTTKRKESQSDLAFEGEAVMEASGELYLFNLSIIAVSFAVVSALVMLMRHSMGGKLSAFDVYLTATYVSLGLLLALAAVLPPLVALFETSTRILWALSSGIAAVALTAVVVGIVKRRHKASTEPISLAVKTSFGLHGVAVLILGMNAIVEPWQGVQLHAAALTLSLTSVSWAFVRRIASILGNTSATDWDPRGG
jgi:hypothetical protein